MRQYRLAAWMLAGLAACPPAAAIAQSAIEQPAGSQPVNSQPVNSQPVNSQPVNSQPGAAVMLRAEDVIAARQAGFYMALGTMIWIRSVVAGGTAVKPLASVAKALALWGRSIPPLFPDGTATGHHTQAAPAIWSDPAGFAKATGDFVGAAERLAQLAEMDDRAGFAAQYRAVAAACDACHQAYRGGDAGR